MTESTTNHTNRAWVIGIDVGSTTVKATVVAPETQKIVWSDYRRHNTRQPECVLEFLERIFAEVEGLAGAAIRTFITGSGAGPISAPLGAKFVQEVNCVTMAVEKLHPDVGSVIELGGQDAKIIIFRQNPDTGDRQAITSMNDKCASGTGATIDKCMIKVGMPAEEVAGLTFDASRLHHVAAKCGVFAETDIVNLVKSGIPGDEVMNSLADAIVMQNLSVLTRGNTLRHKVLLLGGPNAYLPFLQECWRLRIPETWRDRGYQYPQDLTLEQLIFVPENAQYYAAYGAVLYGLHEPAEAGAFESLDKLRHFINHGRAARLGQAAGPPLARDTAELQAFREQYGIPNFDEPAITRGDHIRAVIGLDGGSTSSKCVLIDESGRILKKEYVLSKGNPLQDMKDMLAVLKSHVTSRGATLEVIGFGATGYAANVLEESLKADVNIVETVAHMMSAVHYFGDVDVICDIGGQDIKVLFMKNGDIRNFRLSNQCSAGNGMLLQAMADQFGIPVQAYADEAFAASISPRFSYGCAVFLDSDRVNFQKEGYNKHELLAGLALVLPKNVWQYVVQIPRMASLGRKFVLQGGTQHNLAALKAQVDYIKERVPEAEIFVHPHTGEAGAIGAAFETLRVVRRRGYSTFVGLDAAINLSYSTHNDESTTCHFCPNECSRTFIDSVTPNGETSRYISGFSCEKGTVEDMDALKQLQKARNKIRKAYPNLVEFEAKLVFKRFYAPEAMPDAGSRRFDVKISRSLLGKITRKSVQRGFERSPESAWERRKTIRIGIPKVLNMWSTAPFWRTYFETLGIEMKHIVFSDDTSEDLWLEGGKYGSIDPCYPAKVAQAHIHNLLMHKHEKKPLNYIFFPCITHVPSPLTGVSDVSCCTIVSGTPEVMKSAFTKEIDFFSQRGISYLSPSVTFSEPHYQKQQLFEIFGEILEITRDESDFAADEGWKALALLDRTMQERGRAILDECERDNKVALLMIGRPYHLDPGLNHGVMDEFQVQGYPILSVRSLPTDREYLERYFREDLESGRVKDVMDINEVWPENFSANSAVKVWAARVAARHPNIAVLDLSSFKCGHDSPTYGIIDNMINASGTPYSALHDIDANKPTGSIAIRVKTYAHSLTLHEEHLQDLARKRAELKLKVAEKRVLLLGMKQQQIEQRSGCADAHVAEMLRGARREYDDLKAQSAGLHPAGAQPAGTADVVALSGRAGLRSDELLTIKRPTSNRLEAQ